MDRLLFYRGWSWICNGLGFVIASSAVDALQMKPLTDQQNLLVVSTGRHHGRLMAAPAPEFS